MNREKREKVIEALTEFVIRVSKGGPQTTAEEVQVLPAVAEIVLKN